MDIELLENMEQEDAIRKIFEEYEDNDEIFDLCSELDFDINDVMLCAVQLGRVSFVEEYINEIDEINNEDGYCPLLQETDNEEIIDILKDYGAVYSDDEYYSYRFAYCTTTCEVCSFDEDLQKEAFDNYLDNIGMTIEEFCEFIENGDEEESESLSLDIYSYEDIIEALGVVVENGDIAFVDRTGSDNGSEIVDILTELGYEVKFDGSSWKFETNGYYYLE